MKKLNCLVVADPSEAAASQVVAETARMAELRLVAKTGDEAVKMVAEHKPEVLILSLELRSTDAAGVVGALRKQHPKLFIVATFRELGVPAMNKFAKLGVDDFAPQPIDFTQLYRAASGRFEMPFRRHSRYNTSLEVYRADGVLVGKTLDVSEGGMRMECFHPAQREQSMLYDIALGDSERKLRVRCLVLDVAGKAPQKVVARCQFQNLRGEEHRRLIEFLSELARTMPEQENA